MRQKDIKGQSRCSLSQQLNIIGLEVGLRNVNKASIIKVRKLFQSFTLLVEVQFSSNSI